MSAETQGRALTVAPGVVYGRVDSYPKTRRWHTTVFSEGGSFLVIDKVLPGTLCLKLEHLNDRGELRPVPYGYGCTSFWELPDGADAGPITTTDAPDVSASPSPVPVRATEEISQ